MIIDSHVHAWEVWPYRPTPPDAHCRGSVENLLFELDASEVERAVVVCAGLGGNSINNDYVARATARYPDRLDFVFDADSIWLSDHHSEGAADRLSRLADRYPTAVGFAHYVDECYDGWFATNAGRDFFAAAEQLDLVASISVCPAGLADLRAVAAAHPRLKIVLHHLGGLTDDVLACARYPAFYVKWSGFHYVGASEWDFPYAATRPMATRLLEAFGADRLMWGSDFPASIGKLTYRQSLEMARTYGPPMDDVGRSQMLGLTAARVFVRRDA